MRLLLEAGASRALLYLDIPDVRKSVEELEGRGVDVVAAPHAIYNHTDGLLGPAGTDEWLAFIRDSDGNTLGLVRQLTAGPSAPGPPDV